MECESLNAFDDWLKGVFLEIGNAGAKHEGNVFPKNGKNGWSGDRGGRRKKEGRKGVDSMSNEMNEGKNTRESWKDDGNKG